MLKFVFPVVLSALPYIHAQSSAHYVTDGEPNLWNLTVNDTAYVLASVAYIRGHPSLEGTLLDSLSTGVQVIVKSEGYNLTFLGGIHAPWQEVEYKAGKGKQTGFIWAGLLAFGYDTDQWGRLWLYGLNTSTSRSKNEPGLSLCEVKLLDTAHNLLGRTSFLFRIGERKDIVATLLGAMGLEGLENIYRIGICGEACGVATDYYYLGWTGSSFTSSLPGKSSISDAAIFYYEEQLLFPSEHGLDPGLIIKDIREGTAIEAESGTEILKYKETQKRQRYFWDGRHAQLLPEQK